MTPITARQELAKLIAEQAAEDATDRQPAHPGEVQESSLGRRNLAGYPARSPIDHGAAGRVGVRVLLSGATAWSFLQHGIAGRILDGERIPCPVCRGVDLPASHYCLACDRCGLDGLRDLPGLPVGSAIDPDYPAEPTRYAGEPLLRPRHRQGWRKSRGSTQA